MKAVRISHYGEAPASQDVPVPATGPDEVLVRVEAASLNPLDGRVQSGAMERFFRLLFPYTMGTDLAGTVERVGANITHWRPGDAVIARPNPVSGGAFAEFAAVPEHLCVARPPSLSVPAAAGIPTAAGTAWVALFELAGLQAGQTVLIHAGVGGVGSFAVQLAHAAGARVIATASGDGVALAGRLGADQVIDYRAQAFDQAVSDVDVVIDTVGGETLARSLAVLRPGGHLISSVQPPDEAAASAKGVSARMIALSGFFNPPTSGLATVVSAVHDQALQVLIDSTWPVERFSEAFERQLSGRARGKIILTWR
jgi:NADPH:quinone reductase-like Zn-dependent oxidoreductase